jgi:hypothetical protein
MCGRKKECIPKIDDQQGVDAERIEKREMINGKKENEDVHQTSHRREEYIEWQ